MADRGEARDEEGASRSGGSSRARRAMWLAYLSGGFGLAMFAQVSFIVPLRARELGASYEVIGILVGASALAPAVLAVPLGAVVDRLGPKRAFVFATSAASVIWALFLPVTEYWAFLPLLLVLGPTFSLGWVASQTYITSFGAPGERPRHTGRFSFFSNVGSMLSPVLLGGVAQLMGFQFALVVPAVYCAVFALIGAALTDNRGPDHAATRSAQGAGLRSALTLFGIRAIRVALLLTFVRLWTALVFTTYFPVFLIERGFEPGLAGTVMAVSGLVAALTAPTTGFLVRFASPPTITIVALGGAVAALAIAPHAAGAVTAFVPPVLVGIARGLSLPLLLSMITSASPPDKFGVGLGLRDMVNQTASTLAPVAVGPLIAALGTVLGFTTAGGLAGAILIGAGLLRRRDVRLTAGPGDDGPGDDGRGRPET